MLRAIGVQFTAAQLQDILLFSDVDGDKQIDFEEFTGLMLFFRRQGELDGQDLESSPSRVLRLVHEMRRGGAQLTLGPPTLPPDAPAAGLCDSSPPPSDPPCGSPLRAGG